MSGRHIRTMATFVVQGGRPCQEDFLLANRDKGIFAIADGFGGPLAGMAAAKTACEAVRGFLEREAGDLEATLPFVLRQYFSLAGNVLFNALIHANRKVTQLNRNKNVHEKGGASLLAGFLDGDLLALANVGACGACVMRKGRLTDLVVPRTYGHLCDPFAADVPDSLAVPLMALGMAEDLEPEIVEAKICAGDWLVLHTDGLRRDVRDEILTFQKEGRSASEAVRAVEESLRRQPVSDNVGFLVVIF